MIRDLLVSEKSFISGGSKCTCIGVEYKWGWLSKLLDLGEEKDNCAGEFDNSANCYSICCERPGIVAALYDKQKQYCEAWNSRSQRIAPRATTLITSHSILD